MLTGKLPFRGSVCEILRRIVVEPPVSPAEHRLDLDAHLVGIVLRCLAKNPGDRFRSAEDLAVALQRWLDSGPISTEPDLALAGLAIGARPTPQAPGAAKGRPKVRLVRRGKLALVATVAICVAAGFALVRQDSDTSDKHGQVTAQAPGKTAGVRFASAAAPLKGNVEIMVWSDPSKTSRGIGPVKNGLPVSRADSGALPLQNGELVHLHVTLNRPAYVYLVWVDSDGGTIPLYPWDSDSSDALWEAPLPTGATVPTDSVHCPRASNRGFAAVGAPGMQHVVLLARSTALESPGKVLQAALKDLPSSPAPNSREVAYLEWSPFDGSQVMELRGIAPGKTKEFDAPVFNVLKERLQDDFELIKVWRFAQVAE